MKKVEVIDVVEIGLLSAIIFGLTWIYFPLPISITSGGIIHFGNIGLVVAAIVYGKWKGALAAMIGMTLFDITSGYMLWVPATIIVRFVMGYVIGLVAEKAKGRKIIYVLAVLLGGIIMIAGYFCWSLIIYEGTENRVVASLLSVPGDLIQVAIALLVGLPIALTLLKYRDE